MRPIGESAKLLERRRFGATGAKGELIRAAERWQGRRRPRGGRTDDEVGLSSRQFDKPRLDREFIWVKLL